MWEDPIVHEVRQIRLELEQEADNDLAKLYQNALKVQNEVKSELISKPLSKTSVVSS